MYVLLRLAACGSCSLPPHPLPFSSSLFSLPPTTNKHHCSILSKNITHNWWIGKITYNWWIWSKKCIKRKKKQHKGSNEQCAVHDNGASKCDDGGNGWVQLIWRRGRPMRADFFGLGVGHSHCDSLALDRVHIRRRWVGRVVNRSDYGVAWDHPSRWCRWRAEWIGAMVTWGGPSSGETHDAVLRPCHHSAPPLSSPCTLPAGHATAHGSHASPEKREKRKKGEREIRKWKLKM